MTAVQTQALARYNQLMNESIYSATARLDDAERRADRGAFFKSIHGTLNHLLLVDRMWFGRMIGRPETFESLEQELHADFAELREEHLAMGQTIIDWSAGLDDEQLLADFHYHDMAGDPWRGPLWIATTQFFNHQTHHRGQITTLLSRQSIDVGVTDFPWVGGPMFERG